MDRNTVIGTALIIGLFIAYIFLNAPTAEEREAMQLRQDSIRQAELLVDEVAEKTNPSEVINSEDQLPQTDSLSQIDLQRKYGDFASLSKGTESESILENEKLKITFSNKGAKIKEVMLKEHFVIAEDENHEEEKIPLSLMKDERNSFNYKIQDPGSGRYVNTEELFFEVSQSGTGISFKATTANGQRIEFNYNLEQDYALTYEMKTRGFDSGSTEDILFNWEQYLPKLEKNDYWERTNSTVYFKETEESVDYCSCRSDDEENLVDKKIKWVSHSNQYFNTTLIAEDHFDGITAESTMLEDDATALKITRSLLSIDPGKTEAGFDMHFYLGPNDFKILREQGDELEYIIPYGWSIFGTINRYVIRPLFDWLSNHIGSKGLIIIIITLFVKAMLYPLTYKMLFSQAKMSALKPEISKLKEKYKDDSQKLQMENMKLYREYGVSPFGGCFPMILQMPIWFALYRFFPAHIDFRQSSFLWATDLSSYDVITYLPFEIPFYGAHISLFTLLWVIVTFIYSFYNTQQMEMGAANNPMMKYMQYFMPIMFLPFFNKFASGLTCYMFFSQLFNIFQTLVTKNVILDKEKIKSDLLAYQKQPKKKKSSFQERLETAMKEQQAKQQKKK